MANSNGWGDGSVNNNIGWGQGSNNAVGWGKSHLDSWAGATDIDGGNLPSNSVAPAITGTAQEGQTLTCSTGTWSGSPTYTYQWKRNGSNIGSATNSTYTLVTADVGQSIKCTVTATNFVGSATADSNTVTPTSSTDADAQAFITAASITDPTQQSAINQLVVDLKGYNIWSKMKAIYPMVGGTSTSTSYNLVNTSLYQISWSGGVTWGANGVQFNGVNGFADTNLNAASILTQDSTHLSFYSRTDVIANSVEMGINSTARQLYLLYRYGSSAFKALNRTQAAAGSLYTPTNGFLIANRPNSTTEKYYHKGSLIDTITSSSTGTISANIYIGGYNNTAVPTSREYSSKQCAFASIGDGLTDTEAANFYTAVQAYQTTLGRSIGTQTVSDADAQAFVTNAGIVDQVEANAINNLVIGLKADSLWTKMKAVYPYVGGTSTSTSYNLKNPAQFQISWQGGVTWSNNGVQFGGINGYGITGYNVSLNNTADNISAGVYLRTNSIVGAPSFSALGGAFSGIELFVKNTDNNTYYAVNSDIGSGAGNFVSDTRGMFVVSKLAVNQKVIYRNGTQISSHSYGGGNLSPNFIVHVGARNSQGSISNYDSRQHAFQYIGDILTAAEVGNLTTRVTTFQTALNRNV